MSQHNVCSNSILHGKPGSSVTLENHTQNDVTVNGTGSPNDWPFSKPPAPPFTVTKKVGSNPGTYPVTLRNEKGTYHYSTRGCPDEPTVNPKTVIIG